MYLSSLTHREQLFDVAGRWLADRCDAEDGRIVTEVFAFDRIVTAPTVRELVGDLGQLLGAGPLYLERVFTKDPVREAIAAESASRSLRVQQLVARYRDLPEEFFPRTPVYMSMVTRNDGRLFGMIRRKRTRRIAEKVSRLVADQLATAIDTVARTLADQRARNAGIDPAHFISPPEVMAEEFTNAERIVARRFATGEITLNREAQRVDDVVGVKLIGEPAELELIEQALEERPGTEVVEYEVHTGRYTGTHLLVDLTLPPVGTMLERMHGADWSFASGRGLSTNYLETEYADYVESGSPTFRVELILTTFDNLVESELGDSIHEARVLEQRGGHRYNGRIAQNASYLVEYLLRLALSPTIAVNGLPVKMWGRYLPDTLAAAVVALANENRSDWLLPPGEPTHPLLGARQVPVKTLASG